MHLHAASPIEFVDDRAVGDVEGSVDAGELVGVLAKVEADAADAGLVLDQSEGKMSFAAADFLGRLGERDARGTEDRPRVAHAEGCHLLDLPHDLGSELREGGFAIDADFYVADAPGGLR